MVALFGEVLLGRPMLSSCIWSRDYRELTGLIPLVAVTLNRGRDGLSEDVDEMRWWRWKYSWISRRGSSSVFAGGGRGVVVTGCCERGCLDARTSEIRP